MKFDNLKTIREKYAGASANELLKAEEDALQELDQLRDRGLEERKDIDRAEFLLDLVAFIRKPVGEPADPGQPMEDGAGTRDDPNLFQPQIGYKGYRGLFKREGILDTGGFGSFKEFIGAVLAGGGDRRLRWMGDESPHEVRTVRAMQEDVPSAGGFAVPEHWAAEIFDVALEDAIVAPRARTYPMKTNILHLPAWQIGSHASNVWGGLTCSWKAESGSMTAANPKTRECELVAHKLTAYVETSNELKEDVANFESEIVSMIGKGIGWYMDRSMIDSGSTGDGSGKCLSYLNGPCLIAISKETGQAASTIVYQNLVNILARFFPASFKNAVWVANVDTIPQLMAITIPVGTGGSSYPVLNERNGQMTIFGRPVILTEKCPTLGSQGDLSLCDFSQYAVGMRGDLQIAASPHIKFDEDKTAWRAVVRVDAQPLWDEALTPAESTDTLSPFVTIAARS